MLILIREDVKFSECYFVGLLLFMCHKAYNKCYSTTWVLEFSNKTKVSNISILLESLKY